MADNTEKEILIKVKTDTSDAGSGVDDLKQKITDLNNTDTSKPFKSFRTQVREAVDEAARLSSTLGENNEKTIAAVKYAANLNKQFGDLNDTVKAFNPANKLQAIVGVAGGAVGALQGVTGAMSLLGIKSEDSVKTIEKLQALMAVSSSLNGIDQFMDSFKNLGRVIQSTTIFQQANNATTAAASVVMKLFAGSVDVTSLSFKVLKGAIAATGIGLIVVAIGFAIDAFTKYKDSVDKSSKAMDDYTQKEVGWIKGWMEQTKAVNQLNEALELSSAKSEDDKFRIKQKWSNKNLELDKWYLEQLKKNHDGHEDEAKFQIYTDAINGQIAENDNQKRLQDIRDKANEKRLAKDKEYTEKRKAQQKSDDEAAQALVDKIEIENSDFHLNEIDKKLAAEKRYHEENIKLIEKSSKNSKEKQGDVIQEMIRHNNTVNVLNGKKKDDTIDIDNLTKDALIKNSQAIIPVTTKVARNDAQIAQDLSNTKRKISKVEKETRINDMEAVANATSALSQLAGQQTVVGKGLGIATAIIDTYVGANKAIAQGGFIGTLQAVAVIATGLANVKKIVETQIPNEGNYSGAGGGGSYSVPTVGSAPVINASSTVQTSQAPQDVRVTNSSDTVIRAYITDKDLKTAQAKSNFLNNLSTI